MRLRRTSRPALELTSSEHPDVTVWDGFASATGPSAIIRAARAGELVAGDEVKQVA